MHVDDLHQCQINCSIIVVSCQKLSNFSQVYAKKFLELRLRAHAWGSKYFGTTLKYLDRESKYFEVVGPGGTISGGSIFFVTDLYVPYQALPSVSMSNGPLTLLESIAEVPDR